MNAEIQRMVNEQNAFMKEAIRKSQERAERILALNERLTILGEKIFALKG